MANYETFEAELRAVLNSATGIEARRYAVDSLIDKWRANAPILEKVRSGETSLEQEIEPLLQRNSHIKAPYMQVYPKNDRNFLKEYTRTAKEVERNVGRSISFQCILFKNPIFPVINLMAAPRFPWKRFVLWLVITVALLEFIGVTVGHFGEGEKSFQKYQLLVLSSITILAFLLLVPSFSVLPYRKKFVDEVRKNARHLDARLRQIYQTKSAA